MNSFRLFSIIFLLISCIQVRSQSLDTATILMRYEINNSLLNYKDKAISNELLNKKLDVIFSNVIFNGSDFNSNGSHISYTRNDDKTTIAINTAFKVGYNKFVKGGIHATGNGNIFELYSDKSWSNDIGFNLGGVYTFKNSLYFNTSKAIDTKNKRIKEMEDYALSYTINLNQIDTIKLKKEIQELNSLITIQSNTNEAKIQIDRLEEEIKQLSKEDPKKEKLQSELKLLKSDALVSKRQELEKILAKNKEQLKVSSNQLHLKKMINDTLLKFDEANDPTYGYFIQWLDGNASFDNVSFNLSGDSLITEEVSNLYGIDKLKNNFKMNLSLNYNLSVLQKNFLYYFQVGAFFTKGSYLDNTSLKLTTPQVIQENDELLIKDGDRLIGNYKNASKAQWFGGFKTYGAVFWKYFGLNASFTHNYLVKSYNGNDYKNHFSFLIGPIFKISKNEEWGKATFGVDFGCENKAYKDSFKDHFVAKIKVGVPFSVFKNTKKEDKD